MVDLVGSREAGVPHWSACPRRGAAHISHRAVSAARTLLIATVGLVMLAAGATAGTCDCPPSPTADRAIFKVGTPVFVMPDFFDVPLLASTIEDATFTQMTIEYNSSCLTYVTDSAAPGDDVTNPGTPFVDDIDIGGGMRHVLLNMTGEYSGCDQEVFVLRFRLIGTPPCDLSWDQTLGGPNSNNHMNYDNTGGGDGKITPDDIVFCDATICEPDIVIDGTVQYFSNNEPILPGVPDATSIAVTVEDPIDQVPTTTATGINGDYSLDFGPGPQPVQLEASRPMPVCGTDEDGVISGDDIIDLQNSIAPPGVTDPKLRIAADVNKDGSVNSADVLGIKRWIARKVCDGSDACEPSMMQIKNCAGTWRFIFLTGAGPDGFEVDTADLGSVCADRTVDIQGILVGDFDGSWPEYFTPKPASTVALRAVARPGDAGDVLVSMYADIEAGNSLRHIIYSLEFDPTAFEYEGMQVGTGAPAWDWLDNPDVRGEAHGIAHVPPHTAAIGESGEVIVFRFRPLRPDARTTVRFTRLKANDIDAPIAGVEIVADDVTATPALPARYSVASHPNPFNPSTRIVYTIPAEAGRVSVDLRIYDINGRLVRALERTDRGPGEHSAIWNGADDGGAAAAAGIYFLRIRAGEWTDVEKLTLVK